MALDLIRSEIWIQAIKGREQMINYLQMLIFNLIHPQRRQHINVAF